VTAGEPILEARDVRFSYGAGLPDVLRGVDLTVRRNEMVALLGQNGAGKTTLAKHFNGLNVPTSGTVAVDGRPVTRRAMAEVARTVGFCYQNPDHQIFSSTVEKEVAFGPSNVGYSADEVSTLVDGALGLVGLDGLRKAHPFSLGRGQRQLVAVASVLAMNPPVLVIDEPTTGMDRVGSTRIMELLAQWATDGRAIVAITHDMDIVCEYIARSVVMSDGEVIADGPTDDVFRDAAVLRRAHLVAPAPVVVSNRLAPYGLRPARSLSDAAGQISSAYRGGVDAGRVQRLP
jgi:energy-coupling factor transporter ATP-binding protein EcfA2